MKKKNRILPALAVAAVMLFLAACANTTNASSSSELVAPETSSKELLASSLEYLLQEGKEAASEEANVEVMQISDVQTEEPSGIQVTVYYGNSGSSNLKQETVGIEELTAENLIGALAKHNIVSLDTKVNTFEEEESAEGKVLKLDFSKAFREYLKTMSENGEEVILASVVDTFLEAYDAELIQISVDGEPLETLHESYEEPMRFILHEDE